MPDFNFFQKIISLLTKNDPEADKKRMLKGIAKQLNHSKFKFYKTNGDTALPDLAKLFYSIYKIVANAQAIFQNNTSPAVYKNLIIQNQLTKEQEQLASELEETNILTLARKMPLSVLKEKTQEKLATYMSEFDTEKIEKVNNLYNKFVSFIEFCSFDYYFLLRKYDQNITERDFTYRPKFESIRGEYIVEDLQNFCSIAWSMPLEEDWNDVLDFFKKYRGDNVISPVQWSKLTKRLIILRDQGILEMIIQLALKDPAYKTPVSTTKEHIIEGQLTKMKNSIDHIIGQIEAKQKTAKTEDLLNQIFGTSVVLMLKNYNESSNINFIKHNVHQYTHYQELNYLKAFLIEYCKKEMREFSDLVLVRGKWTSSTLATPMSDAYHGLLNISTKITEFDTSLSEEEEVGTKLKNYCLRAERDKEARNIANNIIEEANETALELLKDAAQYIVDYAQHVKALLEDYGKKRAELVINWKELDRFAEHPIKEQGVSIYKKLYLLISLLKLYLQN